MMQLYCQVQNNAVTQGPMALPFASGNITGLNVAPDPTIYDWYPYSDPGAPTYDSNTQELVLSFTVNSVAKTVTRAYTVQALPPPTKLQLLAYASLKRLQKELGGTTINTVFVPTDVQMQSRILSAYVNATANAAYTINFVKQDGTTVTLTAAQIIANAKQVGAFLEQCRNTEITLDSQIKAGTTTTVAQIDTAFAAF